MNPTLLVGASVCAGSSFLYLLWITLHVSSSHNRRLFLLPLVLTCVSCWIIATTFLYEILMPGFPLGAEVGFQASKLLLVSVLWLLYTFYRVEKNGSEKS